MKRRPETKPAMVRLEHEVAARVEAVAERSRSNTSAVLRTAVFLTLGLLEANPELVRHVRSPSGKAGFGDEADELGDEAFDWLVSAIVSGLPRETRSRLQSMVGTGAHQLPSLASVLRATIEVGAFFASRDQALVDLWAGAEAGMFQDKLFGGISTVVAVAAEEFCDRYDYLLFHYQESRSSSEFRRMQAIQFPTYQELADWMPEKASELEARAEANAKEVKVPAAFLKNRRSGSGKGIPRTSKLQKNAGLQGPPESPGRK